MFFGRLLGWALLFFAVFTASAEAVAALNSGEYSCFATSEMLTIITGISPMPENTFTGRLLLWPAWISMGITGPLLLFFCRRKRSKVAFPMR